MEGQVISATYLVRNVWPDLSDLAQKLFTFDQVTLRVLSNFMVLGKLKEPGNRRSAGNDVCNHRINYIHQVVKHLEQSKRPVAMIYCHVDSLLQKET
jgi:hypothetical protein